MINIKGKTINELVYNCLESIIMKGNRTPSRNGQVSSLYNVFATIDNPKSRHLGLMGRNNNIFATIAETFWVFAGEDKIDNFLSFFLPRAKDFSDDGKTWYGAYGPRLYKYNQLDDIIQQFRNEGIYTRRASFYIGTPERDTKESFSSKLNSETTLDRPCNMAGDFFITPDKKLHLNMKSRSGDVLWGFGSINIFEWTFFQEFMLQQLKYEIDSELTLGEYNHHVTNMHLYDFSGQQGYEVLNRKLEQKLGTQNYQSCIFPNGVENFRKFCLALLNSWDLVITEESTNYIESRLSIGTLFDVYNIPQDNNLLWKYCELVTAYICTKNMKLAKGTTTNLITVDIRECDEEFKQSIRNSIFKKFNIKE